MIKYLGALPTDKWILFVVIGVLLVVFMILPIFTQKRNNKKYKDMINKIHVGDEIKTIGGLIGKIIEIKDKSELEKYMVIESGIGDNKTTLIYDINAVLNVVTPAPEKAEEEIDTSKTDTL